MINVSGSAGYCSAVIYPGRSHGLARSGAAIRHQSAGIRLREALRDDLRPDRAAEVGEAGEMLGQGAIAETGGLLGHQACQESVPGELLGPELVRVRGRPPRKRT